MKNKFFLAHLMIPVLIMAVLAGAIMLEKQGAAGEAYEPRLEILEKMTGEVTQPLTSTPGVVILYHGTDTFESTSKQAVADTLDAMRIAFRAVDLSQEKLPSLTDISMLLFSCRSFAPFENNLEELITWIDQGGKFGIMMAPAVDSSFLVLYRKLGILDFGYELKLFYSLEYTTGLLPLWGDRVFDNDLDDYSLIVRLEPDCIVHMQTADSLKIPLLWERRINKGRIAVLNNSLLLGKNSRGFAVAVLFALEDTMIYPIINAGMVYLDDFPAPQPEGYDQNLLDQYGYSVEDMYKKTWWPDMKYLAKTHGLRYTGGLIETYNDDVIPPFTPGNIDRTQITFYGGEILRSGGEVGLHGFNHMPLSPPGFPYAADEPYLTWPSADYMQASIAELNRYGKELMPDIRLTTYVPPSNYLSDIGRAALLKAAPELRVISAVYMML
ncbi:MAG: DUF2194 domain-containing protein, partial [Clostridiales bacterium]|nr:DUF2194 domain-containing protein [Clostridiales bacterium]